MAKRFMAALALTAIVCAACGSDPGTLRPGTTRSLPSITQAMKHGAAFVSPDLVYDLHVPTDWKYEHVDTPMWQVGPVDRIGMWPAVIVTEEKAVSVAQFVTAQRTHHAPPPLRRTISIIRLPLAGTGALVTDLAPSYSGPEAGEVEGVAAELGHTLVFVSFGGTKATFATIRDQVLPYMLTLAPGPAA